MKKLAYIFAGMTLLMVGCNKETTESPLVPVDNEDELIEISIIGSIPEDKAAEADVTKTDYDFDTDATKAIFSWSNGDRIALVVNNNGTVTNQDRYTLNIASISDDKKTATFSGLIDKHQATGEWKSTGFAVYPVSISQKNTNSGYSSQFVKLASSVDGAKSSVIMVGTPNHDENPDNFEFKVATSVLRVTLKGIPANAKELRLSTSDNNYPVDGDFSLVNTSGIVTIGLDNYLGWGKGYQSIDLSAEGAINSREFLFNIPVGTYPKNTLSLTLYDTDDNVLLSKKVAKDFNFQRNHFISTPELSCQFSVLVQNTVIAPQIKTENRAGKGTIRVHISTSPLTVDNYNKDNWRDGNKFSDPSTSYSLTDLWDSSGNSKLLTSSGKYYLLYIVCNNGTKPESLSADNVVSYGSIPFYYLSNSDNTTVSGTYKFDIAYGLVHYNRSAWVDISADTWSNQLILAASDDITKGNVMITNFFGFGSDGTTNSAIVKGPFNGNDSDINGTYSSGSACYGILNGTSLTFSDADQSPFMHYDGTGVANIKPVGPNIYIRDGSATSFSFTVSTSEGVQLTKTTTGSLVLHFEPTDNKGGDKCILTLVGASSGANAALKATKQ